MSAVPIGAKRVMGNYLGNACRLRKSDECDIRGRVYLDSDSGELIVRENEEDGALRDGRTSVEKLEGDLLVDVEDELSLPDPRHPGSLKAYRFIG